MAILRRKARREHIVGRTLIAPPLPPGTICESKIRRENVRALVMYDIRLGTFLCALDIMEAIPRG